MLRIGSSLAGAQLNTLSLQDVPRAHTGDASSAIAGFIIEPTISRLTPQGIGRPARGVVALEHIVVVLMAINLVCLVMTWLVPNRTSDTPRVMRAEGDARATP